MNEGTTLDHNSFATGIPPDVNSVVHNGGLSVVTHLGTPVVASVPGSGTVVAHINTHESPTMASLPHKVILDNSVMDDQLGGLMSLPRPAYNVEVGFDVPVSIKTMPVSIPIQVGETTNEIKRLVKLELILRDTLGVIANDIISPDRSFTVVMDKIPKPFTGVKEIYMLGMSKRTVIHIAQHQPLPFKLLGIGYEVELT